MNNNILHEEYYMFREFQRISELKHVVFFGEHVSASPNAGVKSLKLKKKFVLQCYGKSFCYIDPSPYNIYNRNEFCVFLYFFKVHEDK